MTRYSEKYPIQSLSLAKRQGCRAARVLRLGYFRSKLFIENLGSTKKRLPFEPFPVITTLRDVVTAYPDSDSGGNNPKSDRGRHRPSSGNHNLRLRITRSLGPPVVPSSTILDAIAHPAAKPYLAELIGGPSHLLSTDWIAMHARAPWEKLTEKPKSEVCVRIIEANGKTHDFLI